MPLVVGHSGSPQKWRVLGRIRRLLLTLRQLGLPTDAACQDQPGCLPPVRPSLFIRPRLLLAVGMRFEEDRRLGCGKLQ